jgi:putative copper export protein
VNDRVFQDQPLLDGRIAIIGTSGCRYRSRLLLTPAFQRQIADVHPCGRRSFGVQTACIVFILALVASLGTLAPPRRFEGNPSTARRFR